jgi:hypothetical protein
MKKLFLIILLFPLLFSCDFSTKENTSRLLPEPDILERLKYQKAEIDTLIFYDKGQKTNYIQLSENDLPFQINSIFDGDYDSEFVLYKDSLGEIICISEMPYSRSGDWFLSLNHYFDKEGKTFAFTKHFNSFMCTNGIGYETITEFYNIEFHIINKEYKLVDKDNNPISKENCMNYDYTVFSNIDKLLKNKKIK